MHPPSLQVETGRRTRHRRCPPRLPHSFFVVVVVILGLDILCCGHRHLSRCTVACLVAPPPLSPRQCLSHCASLLPAVGCCIVTSLAAPAPLSLCRHLSRCTAASLVAPHLRRLVVASPTILTCHRLSCRAGWLSPCYLSLCAAVSLFATSLIAPQSLWVIDPLNPSKKHIGLLGGSSSINPTQRHGTKGLTWGARGQFPPPAAAWW